MSGRLAGKVALVTGAAQGIGLAVTRAFVREGARVLMTDINGALAEEQARTIAAERGEHTAEAMTLDVTSERQWGSVIERARATLGGLSILVNNAGIVVSGGVEDISLDEWRQGMAVNCESVFLGCKAALPLMRENQPASIVNISSIAGLIAGHNLANYNASKAAVWLLSKSIALDCARKGLDIRCNSVHPTFIRTPILAGLGSGKDEATLMEKLVRQVPVGRLGEASEVAEAVLYLASDDSRFVTASEFKIDGGISAM